jgi:pimeloyl-ACP methyl ester carboxylesterase
MPYLDRDGVRIYYEERGAGPAVLLTHGYSASARMWKSQEPLSDRFHLIEWDMRGHDRSDSPDDPGLYSHEATIADMAALLDACGADRAVIGGLSLGGFMSLAFNLARPERVSALMLFDTGPGYSKDAARAEWNAMTERMARALEKRGVEAIAGVAGSTMAPHRSAQGLAHAARGILAQKDGRVIESLPLIAVPALVLAGARDQQFLPSAEYMAAKIPGAQKVILEGAGHAANIDQPEAFNAAVRSFLDRVTGLGRAAP